MSWCHICRKTHGDLTCGVCEQPCCIVHSRSKKVKVMVGAMQLQPEDAPMSLVVCDKCHTTYFKNTVTSNFTLLGRPTSYTTERVVTIKRIKMDEEKTAAYQNFLKAMLKDFKDELLMENLGG